MMDTMPATNRVHMMVGIRFFHINTSNSSPLLIMDGSS